MHNLNYYITYCKLYINKYEIFSICQGYASTIRPSEIKKRFTLGWIICSGWSAAILILLKTASEVECVRVRKWVRGMLKAPAVYENVPSIAVATTWTLLTEAQSWVKISLECKNLPIVSMKSVATLQAKFELLTQKQEMFLGDFAGVRWSKMNVRITGQGSVMSRKSFSGGGPPRYQLQVVSERRIQAYCRACSPFRLLSSSQSVHKHSFSPVDAHGTV